MGNAFHNVFRSTGCRLVLMCCIGLLQAQAQATRSSDLSRWLSDVLQPELSRLLVDYPRYRGRSLEVVNPAEDALSDAITVVLRSALAGKPGISLVAGPKAQTARVDSIDELQCLETPTADLQLIVGVREDRAGGDQVSVTLLEAGPSSDATPRLWHWAGKLTRAERSRAGKAGEASLADGSLDSPWTDTDVQAAASALSRDFACSLRPSMANRVRLQWSHDSELAPVFRDTVNTSRHLLGNYRELALASEGGDYRVIAELRPFRGDTFQLWLTGNPQVPLRDPVQAVTYFRVPGLDTPPAKPVLSPVPPRGNPADYLKVEMLNARQADRGRSADLRVALRLVNNARWPIAYSLRMSGGHFIHCVARPAQYRHDRYGVLSGTLEPGATEVKDLVVEKLQHVPLPWFGAPRCAGSMDLEAFEDYAAQGHRVTDYVRWDL